MFWTPPISIIVELPQSAGHDSIMVIVDSLTKHAHFVSTVTTISAAGATHCYDFERFRLFAAVILASRLRLSSVETKECL